MYNNLKAVKEALLTRNFFQFDGSNGRNSLSVLNNATDLQNIIIRVEKSFNVSQYDFQFDSEKGTFVRLDKQEIAENYGIYKRCNECKLQCFKSEYSVEEFIKLCQNIFKPISVREA